MPSCDLFCRVIDNFGDIAVCWRLARQLVCERGWTVRLFVDDLATFARLSADIDPQARHQSSAGIEIRRWAPVAENALGITNAANAADVADVVIEAFACELPAPYLAAMAARATRPVWLNLEYLSGEDWVAGCHLRASPHPRLPLTKYFFFPGLSAGTGGVIQERALEPARRAFLASETARGALWTSLGIAAPAASATLISLFGYENPAVKTLLAAWRDSDAPLVCIVPESRISAEIARFAGLPHFAAGATAQIGRLSLHSVPFLAPAQYDRLLWLSDLNFVRGEDSFVRAQWAKRPLVWQIYPQAGDAHLPKLDAALGHYGAGLSPAAKTALTDFWRAWNDAPQARSLDWPRFWRHRIALERRAFVWAQQLTAVGNLADQLADFSELRLK